MVLERCFCSYKYVYVYYIEIILHVTHAHKTIIHKVRYLFIRSMYKRPLGLPSRRLLFSSKWKSVKNLQGGIILFYRTFGACHLGLCTTESATTCLWSQTHGRCFEMKSPNISTCPRNPCKHKEFPLQEQRTSPAPKTLFNSVMFKSEWILWTFVKSA